MVIIAVDFNTGNSKSVLEFKTNFGLTGLTLGRVVCECTTTGSRVSSFSLVGR